MVMIDTKLSILNKLIGKKLSVEQLRDLLFDFGMELNEVKDDDIRIELTAERSDLVSDQGLARALSAYLGIKTGLPNYSSQKFGSHVNMDSNLKQVKVEVSKGLEKSWEFAVCAVVKGLKFDDSKIKEIIKVQEKLGEAYLRNRKRGGIGIYPLEKIKFPIKFTAVDADKIKFRPLEYPAEITGRQVLSKHSTGRAYSYLIEKNKKFPVFIDSAGTIMSMPPIINSHDVGKIDETTKDLFIEATGVELKPLQVCLNIIVTTLAEMGGKIYTLDMLQGKKKFATPNLAPISRTIKYENIEKLLGVKIEKNKVKKLLEQMMYAVKISGNKINVLAPAVRTDLWHEVDVIDDIMRAYGVNNFKLRLPNISTIGNLLSETKLTNSINEFMIGLGFQEIMTMAMTNENDQFAKMNIAEQPMIKISGAVETSISGLRTWLLPEAMKTLNCNQNAKLPQKIFELGYTTIPDKTADVLSKETLKLSCVICSTDANYTEAKSVLISLLNFLDVKYTFSETDHKSFISGRCASISVNGKQIGIVGELHPQVIQNWELGNPIAAFEVEIESLLR